MNKVFVLLYFFGIIFVFSSCEMNNQSMLTEIPVVKVDIKPKKLKYGFDLNQYKIVKKKVRRGDTFGSILENNGIDYPEVYDILQSIKNKVSVRRLVAGKSYSLFYSKDSISTPKHSSMSLMWTATRLFYLETVFMEKK